MVCTGTDDHTASKRFHSSSTVVTGIWGRASHLSSIHQTFSIGERSGERAGPGQWLNIFRIKEGPYNTSNMRSCIILLKRRVS
ncbi:hypothetical protein TNCV_1853061 [Trichonephila clavipes]|nr:hypothetical protein TNCV_1853061 [Trichonephila clavipes]